MKVILRADVVRRRQEGRHRRRRRRLRPQLPRAEGLRPHGDRRQRAAGGVDAPGARPTRREGSRRGRRGRARVLGPGRDHGEGQGRQRGPAVRLGHDEPTLPRRCTSRPASRSIVASCTSTSRSSRSARTRSRPSCIPTSSSRSPSRSSAEPDRSCAAPRCGRRFAACASSAVQRLRTMSLSEPAHEVNLRTCVR